MKRQIVDMGKIARHSRHIAVIFPMNDSNMSKSNIVKLIKDNFSGCKIYAIVSKGSEVINFDEIVYLDSNLVIFGRKFFKTKELLRNLDIDLSFDLNQTIDIITYLVGASLRIGIIDSPFFNVVVKGANNNPNKMFSIFNNNPLSL